MLNLLRSIVRLSSADFREAPGGAFGRFVQSFPPTTAHFSLLPDYTILVFRMQEEKRTFSENLKFVSARSAPTVRRRAGGRRKLPPEGGAFGLRARKSDLVSPRRCTWGIGRGARRPGCGRCRTARRPPQRSARCRWSPSFAAGSSDGLRPRCRARSRVR